MSRDRIRNSAWAVRYYRRGARSSIGREQREAAIRELGLAVREAFNSTDDFEPLLAELVEGLRPRPTEEPF